MSTQTGAMREADRWSRDAALVLGLTLPTDTLLYLLLPLHAAGFGVSLVEVGLLLAANRLVRIIGYGWVARGYERNGPRLACVLAVFGSALSSLGYALLPGVWWLLVARLIWGLSFAAMNIATQALATHVPEGAARRNGRSRAIIAAGPMFWLPAGAGLAEWQGPHAVFIVLAVVALLGLPFALRLPGGQGEKVTGGPRMALPRRLDVWSFVQGMALDGVFVLGLSLVVTASLGQGAILAAGAALSIRYVSEILLGPAGGALGERFGGLRMLILLSLASATGLALVGLGAAWPWALWPGVLLVVGLRGLLQPLPAPVAAALSPPDERVSALARLATWRDLGAGVGPLLAGALMPVLHPSVLYVGTAVALAGISAALWGRAKP